MSSPAESDLQAIRISDSNIFWLNLNKIAKKNIIIKKEAVKYIFEILYLNKPVFQSHYFWVLQAMTDKKNNNEETVDFRLAITATSDCGVDNQIGYTFSIHG